MCDTNFTIRTSPNRFLRPVIQETKNLELQYADTKVAAQIDSKPLNDEVQMLRKQYEDLKLSFDTFQQTIKDVFQVRDTKFQFLVDEFIKLKDTVKLENDMKVEQFNYFQTRLAEMQNIKMEPLRKEVQVVTQSGCATNGCVIRTSPRRF